MTNISVIILQKNEALHIKRCIERFLEPRLAWMSEAGGKVILDHGEIRFRPRSDGF